MHDALIRGQCYGLRRIHDARHVAGRHFLVLDRDDAVRIQAFDVTARDAGIHGVDLHACHQLRLLHGTLYRLHGRVDVHHDATAEAAARGAADADHLELTVGLELRDERHDLRRADVESYDQVPVSTLRHRYLVPSPHSFPAAPARAATAPLPGYAS